MSVLTAEQSKLRTQLAQIWAHYYYDPDVPFTALSEEEIRHSYEVADQFFPTIDALRKQIATAERRARLEETHLHSQILADGVGEPFALWLQKRSRELSAPAPEGRKG